MPPKKSTVAPKAKPSSSSSQKAVADHETADATTSGNPDVEPPSVPIERVDESILLPSDPNPDTMEIDAPSSSTLPSDPPGPSTAFIPREPSPPLPNLRSERFPPEPEDDGDSSDDEVIATLPIYLSPAIHPDLHLYQFPLQTRSLVAPTYARDRGKGITARIKERAARIEVEIPVDAGSDVWRDDRARELGMTHDMGNGNGVVGGYGFGGRGGEDDDMNGGASSKKKKGKAKDEKRWGDKIRLRSEAVPSTTGYYAGVVQDGALHLHPLSRILQMRTALNYLDDAEERSRSRRGRGFDDEEEEKEEKKPKPAAPTVPIKALRKVVEDEGDGSGSIKDFRNKMWRLAQEEQDDTWVAYDWREGEDDSVVDALQKLILPEEKRERLKCLTKGLDYLDALQ